MAQAAKLKDLVGGLVHSVTGRTQGDETFTRLCDPALKTLQNASRSRTNQFDIESKLNGLGEKFAALNRDDLAEALQQRLDELPKDSKWLPELLSLFLHLSDRPLEKTDIEALNDSTEQPLTELALTWDEILADEPLTESDIWEDIERGYHSSGDDATVDGEADSDPAPSTHATSVEEDDAVTIARRYVVHPADDPLKDVEAARDHLSQDSDRVAISELTFIRETLSMLHGLPTTVFDLQQSTGLVKFNPKFHLETASRAVFRDALIHFADIGSSLNMLRSWVRRDEEFPFLRSCQASVRSLSMKSSAQLAEIELGYLSLKAETVVSLIDVRSEVDRISRPVIHLSGLILEFKKRNRATPWIFLDHLHDEISLAQLSGDVRLVSILVDVFLAGLKAYNKPVSTWIRSGLLELGNETFFVVESESGYTPETMWRDRFAIRQLSNGTPCVPKFMHAVADQIYRLGKSRAFLRALNGDDEGMNVDATATLLDCQSIRSCLSEDNFMPFSQLCEDILTSWIIQTSKDCTPLLCRQLLHDQGLLKTLEALHHIFCSTNGRAFQAFAETLFWRMDHGYDSWKDPFLLTELVQSTVGGHHSDLAANITVQIQENETGDDHHSSIRQLAAINMMFAFSWPLQNITACDSPRIYSKASTLLLQVYRAKYLLGPQLFDLRSLDGRTKSFSHLMQAALKIRLALLSTVDILHGHITSTSQGLETAVRKALEEADDIDDMGAVWADHSKSMATSLLLSDNLRPVREAIIDILELCERFMEVWRAHNSDEGPEAEVGVGEAADEPLQDHSSKPSKDLPNADLERLKAQLDKSLSFLQAGLRGISRAGGNTALEVLAERLQWLVQ